MASELALVTGGGGFLGRAIVERLLAQGMRVRVLARGDYPDLRSVGVELIRADIASKIDVMSACAGCDVIFHTAAKAGLGGNYREYHDTNYLGTLNVLAAQNAHRIPRLVYTSSPSVVFGGGDLEGVDESIGYARKYKAAYPQTKAMAERAVLESNSDTCATIALRPHLIWGPGDNHLIPRIIVRAQRLRRIGKSNPLIDCTYIDNAADAHLFAANRLSPGATCGGRAYFISNGQPRPLWDIINSILSAAGMPPVEKRVSRLMASSAAVVLESIYKLLRLSGEPAMTRFLLDELTHTHWFNIAAARRDLGYEPRVTIDAGMQLLREWLTKKRPPAKPEV